MEWAQKGQPPPRNNILGGISDSSGDDDDVDWRYVINNARLYELTRSTTINAYYQQQQINWVSHVIRRENNNVAKILTFHSTKRTKLGRKSPSILDRAVQNSAISRSQFLNDSFKKMNEQPSSVM